jgi:hypothetical protein
MSENRYSELRELNRIAIDSFSSYEEDCQWFVQQFREQLVRFIGSPDDKVALAGFKDASKQELEANGIVEITPNGRMVLHDDAFYEFAPRIDLDAPEYRWILLHLRVKKSGDAFTLAFGTKEWTIPMKRPLDLGETFTNIYPQIEEYVGKRFERFVHAQTQPSDQTRKLGFETRTSREDLTLSPSG